MAKMISPSLLDDSESSHFPFPPSVVEDTAEQSPPTIPPPQDAPYSSTTPPSQGEGSFSRELRLEVKVDSSVKADASGSNDVFETSISRRESAGYGLVGCADGNQVMFRVASPSPTEQPPGSPSPATKTVTTVHVSFSKDKTTVCVGANSVQEEQEEELAGNGSASEQDQA